MEKGKKKKFLDKPQYPGGKEAFKKFILENLKYPKEAIEKQIEGTVYVTITVTDNGDVIDAKVTKGIGHGCNEEAVRLVKLLKYEGVKNRGVRLTVRHKIRINFKLEKKETKITYTVTKETPKDKPKEEQSKGKEQSYGYTITW